jgi:TolA-binding protein
LKKERAEKAEHLLREYLRLAPNRTAYPRPWEAHNWLGQLYEGQQNAPAAVTEYQATLKLDPKNKFAREALKRLGKN